MLRTVAEDLKQLDNRYISRTEQSTVEASLIVNSCLYAVHINPRRKITLLYLTLMFLAHNNVPSLVQIRFRSISALS